MKKKVLVLGVSGMLGSTLSIILNEKFRVFGVYNKQNVCFLDKSNKYKFKNIENIYNLIFNIKPDFIINCIGLIPQNKFSNNVSNMIYLNGELPHQIIKNIKDKNTQFIQINMFQLINLSNNTKKWLKNTKLNLLKILLLKMIGWHGIN